LMNWWLLYQIFHFQASKLSELLQPQPDLNSDHAVEQYLSNGGFTSLLNYNATAQHAKVFIEFNTIPDKVRIPEQQCEKCHWSLPPIPTMLTT
jgi:hypothetical protein